ncbi:conserved hypothetical protein [Myxococcus xanthus DK 1622]|uniref:Methyltransferase domain-containing protein n=1 Tax=Myxococcus xanthus (strain DK1622) TaxID=246197 RepID=Q1DG44_MYXXD|nr:MULTISPECIES: class I SAM-dependent methyltransferase [Myxococcus]ABF87776.1 conserved hypothetical protein [Myxococcus xanthus DK 1622]NOJ54276.1 methyltransferase domain-containing protein [Myxococcus xanthus]QPM79832.1 methyltransferase domain-containing protein [Myxococcus xanthus]QVW68896.1 methyltransferase domain-containing protein [Myxococcus xanthus DZ2]QZZ47657.1 Trans-aconitate 2-methyltransferase [Myxococcus xanthus]
MSEDAFFTVYGNLPRHGPGSDDCTREALRRLPPLPPHPRVVDLGCGAGAQTLVLAEALRTRVIAVDLHEPFLDQLKARARERGLDALIDVQRQDMGALSLPEASFDLLWSEGAIYHLGFGPGLRRWRPLLAPGGLAAVTECTWLTDERPDEIARFWGEVYPTMGTVLENRAAAETAGYEVLDTFTLPASAWWDTYYTPLLQRVAHLRAHGDASLEDALSAAEQETRLYRQYEHTYGYVFHLLRNPSAL